MQTKAQLWKEEIIFLREIVGQLPKRSTIVEIGTAQGGGLEIIAKARKFPNSIAVHSYDPFPSESVMGIVSNNPCTYSHALHSEIGAERWDSTRDGDVNLLIVDGSHELVSVYTDYVSWKSKLSKPAILLFHDYDRPERDGASHPGVKVFCDCLLNKIDNMNNQNLHIGRYLFIQTDNFPNLGVEELKEAFQEWITRAKNLWNHHAKENKIGLEETHPFWFHHSRFRNLENTANVSIDHFSDTSICLNGVDLIPKMHQQLIDHSKDVAAMLKWIEYLEMFKHMRGIDKANRELSTLDHFLDECEQCDTVLKLSQLCAETSVVIGLVEAILFNVA